MGFLDDIDPKTALAACGLVVMAALSTATDPASPASTSGDPVPTRGDREAVSRAERPDEKADGKAEAKSGEKPGAKSGDKADKKESADKKGKAEPKKLAVPSNAALLPHQPQGNQSFFQPTRDQVKNARTITRVGRSMGLPPRAAVVAVATSLQESKLENLGHLGASNDHDSQGLFQQRPTSGWGTPEQITNPEYASAAFYKALTNIPQWQSMPLSQAAQQVQVSAFPLAYAQWEIMAHNLVKAYYGEGPYAAIARG